MIEAPTHDGRAQPDRESSGRTRVREWTPAQCCEPYGAETCDLEAPDSSLRCTREPGHDGPHVACTAMEHRAAVWGDLGLAEAM